MALSSSTIVTSRLILSPLVPEDADEMFDALDDERMHEFTGGRPLTLDELRSRYRRLAVSHATDDSELWFNWVVRLSRANQAVGVMQATVAADGSTADVAWEIGVPFQGEGFASESAAAVVQWLIDQGVPVIRAFVHPDHVASARVATHAGLQPTLDRVDGEVVRSRPPRVARCDTTQVSLRGCPGTSLERTVQQPARRRCSTRSLEKSDEDVVMMPTLRT